MNVTHARCGWIEVITGGMFSGKTEELIRRLRRAQIAKQRIQIFKPKVDTRYDTDRITSHNEQSLVSTPVDNASQILEMLDDKTRVIGIDEAQFFDINLVEVSQKLANMGIRVIVAGLDQDYKGMPFDPIPQLMAVAEYITKNSAICVVCGNPASKSQRITAEGDRIRIGAKDAYEARCRECFEPFLQEKMAKGKCEVVGQELVQ